jgi:hypothetical protein
MIGHHLPHQMEVNNAMVVVMWLPEMNYYRHSMCARSFCDITILFEQSMEA